MLHIPETVRGSLSVARRSRPWRWAVAAVTCAFTSAGDVAPPPTELPPPGGSWTRPRQPGPTYIAPAWHLDADEQLDFYTGMSFFRSPWVTAPSSTTARDGLGPLFNSHSCAGCHRNGGRGRSLLDDPDSLAAVVRIGQRAEDGEAQPHPRYGTQLQVRATFRRAGEATVAMEAVDVAVPGGTLRAPRLHVQPTDPEENPEDWLTSVRVAPALLGLGLLEAIPAPALLSNADPEDADADGVSGRPHWRGAEGGPVIGRFGRKALHPTVASQTGAAFRDDIGITNPQFPDPSCTALQTACLAAPDGNDVPEGVELPGRLFDYVVHFVSHLPPPKAGKLTDRVRRGQATFHEVGCASCHTPRFDTRFGAIWPYTDLLLHDMGDGLADGRPEGDASGREWRTPPLWGVGTALKVSGHTTLLHDGRARDVTEAILWHGGEAASAQERFRRLSDSRRNDLVAFVNAL